MTTISVYEHTPDDVTKMKNTAMEMVLQELCRQNYLTDKQAEQFLSEYTFTNVKNTSLLARIRQYFTKDYDPKSVWYMFPLVKVRIHRPE